MFGFGITIYFELKNGKKISFGGSGFQEAIVNYFQDWASITISPKQLASASSVDEMIALLANNVADGDTLIFQNSNPIQSEVVEENFDAYDFVKMIKENISEMSDISSVVIELREYNEMHFYRKYTYECSGGKYTGVELGTPEAAEEYIGEYMDQSILNFSDIAECKIVKRADLYKDSDPDDDFYGFSGCTVL